MSNPVYAHRLRPSTRFVAAGAGVVALFLLAGVVSMTGSATAPGAPRAVAAEVEMTNTLKFTPGSVTVEVGETVRWTNTSVIVHTVTADPAEATMEGSVQLPEGAEAFDSGTMDSEATFEHTFETPGTYTYFCIPHEGVKMRGTVVVEPGT